MTRESLIAKLVNTGNLFYAATNINVYVIDIIGHRIKEIPQGSLQQCLCKKISSYFDVEVDLSHMFHNCRLPMNMNCQLIYKCPYGLTNFIIPIFEDNELQAALLGGPVMTKPAKDFIREEISPHYSGNQKVWNSLEEEIERYNVLNINQVVAFSEVLRALSRSDIGQIMPTALFEEKSCNKWDESSNLIDFVIHFISDNYAEDITLGDAAKAAYVNPSYLSRVFNKVMNVHFRSYLNGVRIGFSKTLLAESDMSISDVCRQSGFSDQSHYDRVFKQQEGITPTQYRQKHRGKQQPAADFRN